MENGGGLFYIQLKKLFYAQINAQKNLLALWRILSSITSNPGYVMELTNPNPGYVMELTNPNPGYVMTLG